MVTGDCAQVTPGAGSGGRGCHPGYFVSVSSGKGFGEVSSEDGRYLTPGTGSGRGFTLETVYI